MSLAFTEMSGGSTATAKQAAMRALLQALVEEPTDYASAQVLADRCEELGFTEAAEGFRSKPTSLAWLKARAGLRLLFGDGGVGGAGEQARGSYNAVFGLPPTVIGSCKSVVIVATVDIDMIVKRLYIGRLLAQQLTFQRVRAGRFDLLANTESVSGELFEPSGPDLFHVPLRPGQQVLVEVTNTDRDAAMVAIAVLGLMADL